MSMQVERMACRKTQLLRTTFDLTESFLSEVDNRSEQGNVVSFGLTVAVASETYISPPNATTPIATLAENVREFNRIN
jgi:hypothetical protein